MDDFYSDEKMQELIEKLNYYTKLYDEGHPEISDKEYDDLYFQLQDMENVLGYTLSNSPTQKIDYQVVNKLNKVKHSHDMLSLDKTKEISSIKNFLGQTPFIAMPKLDGLTCSLTYQNGKLVKAETRGNGLIGEDVLHNVLHIANVPNTISYENELVVDGEVICTYDNFKNFKNEYKNPRNFASGSIRLLDSNESANRKLSFIAWDLINEDNDRTLDYKLVRLTVLGFKTVFWYQYGEIEDIIKHIQKDSQELGYPIDGVVFKYNYCKDYEAAGRTDHHFKGGLAYKFYDEEYETVLRDIEWTMGRTGQLTPVAVYEDVDIDGTICNRASLHNLTIMKETLGKYGWKNQKIKVFKANQIIPQISWAEPENEYTKEYFNYPMICPICGQPTEIKKDNDSEVLYCGNPECEGKVLNQLDHFCSKKGLDIKGLSKATLEKLIDWGWVNEIRDIFKLSEHEKEWKNKAGFGEKSVMNILTSIQTSCNTNLESVISAAGIPLIGRTVARQIANIFNTYESFRKAIRDFDFSEINGFGYEMNKSLKNYNYDELDYIVNNFLTINNQVEIPQEKKLEGLVFCVTGKIKHWKNRDDLSAFITNLGGKVVGSISSNVNYLINNDVNSTSSKNIRAKELDIKIIDEQTFMDMFDFQK